MRNEPSLGPMGESVCGEHRWGGRERGEGGGGRREDGLEKGERVKEGEGG